MTIIINNNNKNNNTNNDRNPKLLEIKNLNLKIPKLSLPLVLLSRVPGIPVRKTIRILQTPSVRRIREVPQIPGLLAPHEPAVRLHPVHKRKV